MKWNWEWKTPHMLLERQTLCFSSYWNHKLKVKLWWIGACERKKSVTFILSEGHFFDICVLSQFVCWINFHNIYTFTYKTLLHTIFCSFLKLSKTFSVSLMGYFCKDVLSRTVQSLLLQRKEELSAKTWSETP